MSWLKSATDDCQRRRRHQQAHQRVGAHGADDRHDEARLAGDLDKRATAGAFGQRRRLAGIAAELRQDRHRHQSEDADGEEAAGEGNRAEQVAGQDDRLRADDRRGDAAGQHPGDGAGAEGGAADIGRGEAVLLGEGGGEADGEQADGEEDEGADEHRIAGDETAEDGDARA